MTKNKLSEKEFSKLINNKKVRREIAKESFLHFFSFYLPDYLKYDLAPFHHEIIDVVQNPNYEKSVIIAFRNSGKSTLITTAGVLWSVFGIHQKKNILIISQTQDQAYGHLNNVRMVLEDYRIVKEDFGPFKKEPGPWNSKTLIIPKFNAKITAASLEQSVRGLRHGNLRPDLIICDDLEDSRSIATEEGREKTKKLYSGEIATLGDFGTTTWLVGNFLHRDSLLMELKANIEAGEIKGKALFIPLVNKDGSCNWPQKFKTQESIRNEKAKIANNKIWSREYLLEEVRDDDQVIFYQDIHYYENIPSGTEPHFKGTIASIDPARSEKETADYTGIVFADIYRIDNKYKIFIRPRIINKRIKPRDLQDEIIEINSQHKNLLWLIEDANFQSLLLSQLGDAINFEEIKLHSKSKKERLYLASKYIRDGSVQFPKGASKKIVDQMVNLDQVRHDDLADAVSQLVNYIFDKENEPEFASSAIDGPLMMEALRSCASAYLPDNSSDDFSVRTLENDPLGWDSNGRSINSMDELLDE